MAFADLDFEAEGFPRLRFGLEISYIRRAERGCNSGYKENPPRPGPQGVPGRRAGRPGRGRFRALRNASGELAGPARLGLGKGSGPTCRDVDWKCEMPARLISGLCPDRPCERLRFAARRGLGGGARPARMTTWLNYIILVGKMQYR